MESWDINQISMNSNTIDDELLLGQTWMTFKILSRENGDALYAKTRFKTANE